jgi:hypothetical protein
MISLRKISYAAAVALLFLAGTASAQFVHAGNPDVTALADMTSGSAPTVLEIQGLSNIEDYAFDGSDLEIPFTLSGSGAKVWLIIYTDGQSAPLTISGEGPAPYNDPEHPDAGWHVYEGTDWLVYKSDGQRFEEGNNAITWNGKDQDGANVAAGSYKLFLAAFDDEATPHLVAGAVFRKLGTPGRWIIDLDRGVLFDHTRINNMTNDWIDNFEGVDLFDATALTDAGGGTPLSGVPLNSDNTEFIGIGQNNLLQRWTVDWDANRLAPVEDWGLDFGSENGGVISIEELPGSAGQRTLITNADKSIGYVTAGVSGTVAQIVGYDVATGEKLSTWDLTDLFIYDNNGADRVGGPMETAAFFNGEPDATGITTTSHHTSVILRLDWDGNVMWMNRNGDGFGDSRAFNSADGSFGDLLYGHTEAPNFKYSLFAANDGWVSVCENGLDNVSFGAMLGEDGSGLFHFQPKQVPLTWSQHVAVVDEGTAWDGVYMTIGGFGDALPNNDWADNDVTVPATHPVAQWPYDQKSVTLGMASTDVTELASNALPQSVELGNAYPNPFNPETTINFSLPWEASIQVKIYNDQGQLVRTLVDQNMGPGEFAVTWDGTNDSGVQVASGMYLYKIEGPDLKMQKKVTFLK